MASDPDRIETLAHRDAAVAQQIHAVLQRAHVQEAALLGMGDVAPLQRTANDIRAEAAVYLGAWRGTRLLGTISVARDDEPGQLTIATLTVEPEFQRQGVAHALLQQALRLGDGMAFSVSTTEGNAPALALYASVGFVPYRHGAIGPDALPLVKLRRAPASLAPEPAAAHDQAPRHGTGSAGPSDSPPRGV